MTRGVLHDLQEGFSQEGEKRSLLVVELVPSLTEKGLVINSSQEASFSDVLFSKGISCYVLSKNAYRGRLIARAYNEAGIEIGASPIFVHFLPDVAQKITFEYPRSLNDKLVTKYVIDALVTSVQIDIAPDFEAATGLRLSQVREPLEADGSLTAYAVATRPFAGSLVLKVYSAEKEEIYRGFLSVAMGAEAAETLTFHLPKEASQGSYFLLEAPKRTDVPIEVADNVAAVGLTLSQYDTSAMGQTQSQRISCYAVASRAFAGTLIAKAWGKDNVELERSRAHLSFAVEEGKEIQFYFTEKSNGFERFTIEYLLDAGIPTLAAESMKAVGLSLTRADDKGLVAGKPTVACHVIASKAFAGKLVLRAMNSEGTEIGRAESSEFEGFSAADAKEVIFTFSATLPVERVTGYIIEAR